MSSYKAKYPEGRDKGFTSYRPRKHKRLAGEIVEVLERYREWLPMHPRSILYRLVEEYGYPKTDKFWGQVKDLLTNMRRGRLIPFEDVGDNRTQVSSPPIGYRSPEDFWRKVRRWANHYRRERDEGQPYAVELWVEAAGTVGIVEKVAHKFDIDVYTASGFNGVAMMHEAAERIVARGKATVILHLGDLDPSGECIYDAMSEDVRLFLEELADGTFVARTYGAVGVALVRFVRVALTREQAEELNLPTKPRKSTDKRGDFEGGTVQLEALAPDVLAEMVEAAIADWYDLDVWSEVVAAEDAERAELLRQADLYLPEEE